MLQSVKIDKVENGFLLVNSELEAGERGFQPVQKAYIFTVFADVLNFLADKQGDKAAGILRPINSGQKELDIMDKGK